MKKTKKTMGERQKMIRKWDKLYTYLVEKLEDEDEQVLNELLDLEDKISLLEKNLTN